jgi:hypothetical protein
MFTMWIVGNLQIQCVSERLLISVKAVGIYGKCFALKS